MYPTAIQGNDEELEARIATFLAEHSSLSVADLTVKVTSGEAIVSGQVETLREKSQVIDACRHIPGVMRVNDRLSVLPRRPK